MGYPVKNSVVYGFLLLLLNLLKNKKTIPKTAQLLITASSRCVEPPAVQQVEPEKTKVFLVK
jgi:hypothetical protein